MSDRPQTFDEQQVAEAVKSLPEWSGDVHMLSRKVALDPAKVDQVMDEVHDIEGEMNHHAQIESVPSDDAETLLTLKVWTHTVGGVTDLDIELAHRIEKVLDDVSTS
jgi:4a-hydroxytetrahydrobiopterin dehydratase